VLALLDSQLSGASIWYSGEELSDISVIPTNGYSYGYGEHPGRRLGESNSQRESQQYDISIL